MKPLTTPLLMLCLILAPASALAGEALPELKGEWIAESMNGEPPEEGAELKMVFVDDDTLRAEYTFQGETKSEEIKYTATKDGTITIFPEPDTNPEGEKATWEIKDKKLHLKTEENELLIFKRPG